MARVVLTAVILCVVVIHVAQSQKSTRIPRKTTGGITVSLPPKRSTTKGMKTSPPPPRNYTGSTPRSTLRPRRTMPPRNITGSTLRPRNFTGTMPPRNITRRTLRPRTTMPSRNITGSTLQPRNFTGTMPPRNITRRTLRPRTTMPSRNITGSTLRPRNFTGTMPPRNITRRTLRPPTTMPPRNITRRTIRPRTTGSTVTVRRRTATRAPIKATTVRTWVTKTLSVDQKKKLNGAFDTDSTTSFTGTSMFDSKSGNMSNDFVQILDSSEKQTVEEIQSTWKDVINMETAFKDSLPEDLQFFVQEFKQMDQSKLRKLTTAPSTMTPADLKDVPLSIIASINETERIALLDGLQDSVKDVVCNMLQNDEADYDTTKDIAKAVNCSDSLGKRNIRPKGTLSQAIADIEQDKEDPSTWSDQKWEESIKQGWFNGLTDNVMDKVPPRVLKNNLKTVTKLIGDIDDKLRDRVFNKIKTATGGYDKMSAADMKDMGDMLGDMSLKDMKQLNASAVRDSLSTFRSKSSTMSRAQKMQMKKTVKDGMPPIANWTGDDIVNSAPFLGRDKTLVKKLNVDALVRNISDIGSQNIDPKSSRTLLKKLRESSKFNKSTSFTTDSFKEIGNIATGLSPRSLKKMKNVDFGDLLNTGSLKDKDFSKDSARAIVEMIKNDTGKLNGNLDKTEIIKLGKSIKGLRKTEIDNINADEMAEALDNMTDTISEVMDDFDDTTIDSIISKLETATGGLGGNLEKMGSLLQKVSVKKLKMLTDSDFGDMSGKTERAFNCSKKTCPELYKRVTNSIGRPSLKNPNMTITVFRNLKKVMCGIPLDDLKILPATKLIEETAGYLLKLECLSDKQERILAEKIKYRLGFFSNSLRRIRRQDIKKFGGLFKHFSYTDLKRFDSSVCPDIALELGSQDLSNVQKDDLKSLTKFAVECMNKEQGTLTTDDMTSAGDLVCGLPTDRISDIEVDVMPDIVYKVQKRCALLSSNERKDWAMKAMSKLNITSSNIKDQDDADLLQMGSFMKDIGDSYLDQISKDKISSIASDIADEVQNLKDQLDKIDDKGFGREVSDDDRKDSDSKDEKLYKKLIDAFASTSSRRRRSVTGLTCDDMQLLGSGVTALSTSQIEATDDSEFLDCANFLGGFSSWTSQQLLSLLTVASRSGTYGATSGWTADHVYNAGIINQGLTSSELTALTDLTIDSMYSAGRHSGWSETQLSAGFSRWLNLNKLDNAASITSTELISLGHFACGASTAHIGLISSTVYSYAASYVGELTSCTQSQQEAYATHAKSSFGAVTTWDTSVITTIGTIIGGLSASELASLSLTQVAAIEPSSIAEIPSSSFVGLTVDQLSSFSVAQAQSTTSNQQSGLSTDQLNALISAGATVYSSSAAVEIQVSTGVLFFTLAIAALKQLMSY